MCEFLIAGKLRELDNVILRCAMMMDITISSTKEPFKSSTIKTKTAAEALQSVIQTAGAMPRGERDEPVIARVEVME